jgi:lipoyl(octanoyl) transferase
MIACCSMKTRYNKAQMATKTPQQQRTLRLIEAGTIEYQTAWEWQRHLVAERSRGRERDTLLLLEHPATITLGRSAHRKHILVDAEELANRGVALVESDRGGDVTYHAPGQLVGYPILKLAYYGGNVLDYLRNLEEVIIQTIADYGLHGKRIEGLTGVWVSRSPEAKNQEQTISDSESKPYAKIAAIGVKLSASGVTSHGFALNVSPNLDGFRQIVPCGIRHYGVTSLEQQLADSTPSMDDVRRRVVARFTEVFEIDQIDVYTTYG